jgi:nucleotide-binding universal stress UspA family protein
MRRILVGVDGSEPSEHALRWAFDEARVDEGAVVTIVHAYRPPEARSYSAYSDAFLDPASIQRRSDEDRARRGEDEVHVRQGAEQVLERLVDAVRTEEDRCEVKRITVPKDAAKTLIDMSRDADLLVVGSRGRGGFAGLLLGSVSQQCVRHARCPVLVVR